MAATQTEDYVQLKLVVNEENNKVIFAEAGKDFVDVLFSFLTFPLGTITRLVQKESNMETVTIGCLNKLYQSVADLDKECMSTNLIKGMLLQPSYSLEDYCSSLKLNIDDTQPTKYYTCTMDLFPCGFFYTLRTSRSCPHCGARMTHVDILKQQFCDGFVKDGVTFVISDDLMVLTSSMDITSFVILQNFGINNTNSIKEMTLNVTKEKVLDLLKLSLVSKSTLTNLCFGMKPTLGLLSGIFSCNVETTDTNDFRITVKLVIRKSDGKILYAQGDHDFASFVLSFLSFPLGGVVSMFGGNSCLGSIDPLYQSIVDLDENKYFVSKEAKNRIVDPHLAPQFRLRNQILPIREPRKKYYWHDKSFITCENRDYFLLETDKDPIFIDRSVQGYVKGPRTYVVTDDLVVTESSPTSVLHLISQFQTPVCDLKEKVINIGVKECLSIFKASLTTASALTNGLGHLLAEVQEG